MTTTSLMMPFDFEGKTIRFVGTPDAPEWVASDVCEALALTKGRTSLDLVPASEKGAHTVGTPGGPQTVVTLKEPGLYRMIFRSRKPEAERLKAFVFNKVLPEIRRTGSYTSPGVLSQLERQSAELTAARLQIQLLADISSKQASLAASILASRGNQMRVEDRAFSALEHGQRLLVADAGPVRTIERKGKRRARPLLKLSGGN